MLVRAPAYGTSEGSGGNERSGWSVQVQRVARKSASYTFNKTAKVKTYLWEPGAVNREGDGRARSASELGRMDEKMDESASSLDRDSSTRAETSRIELRLEGGRTRRRRFGAGGQRVRRSASMFPQGQSAEGGEGRTTTLSIEGGGAAVRRQRQQHQLNQLDERHSVRQDRDG